MMDNDVKIILLTPMRVGSMWLWYLLEDAFSLKRHFAPNMKDLFPRSRHVVKAHGPIHNDVFKTHDAQDYSIVTIVRNPWDVLVSRAFYEQANGSMVGPIRSVISQQISNTNIIKSLSDMVNLSMAPGYATRSPRPKSELRYVWTTYEWLVDDTSGEMERISSRIGIPMVPKNITRAVNKQKLIFESQQGNPKARRKGVVGDWVNHLNAEHVLATQDLQALYWKRIAENVS